MPFCSQHSHSWLCSSSRLTQMPPRALRICLVGPAWRLSRLRSGRPGRLGSNVSHSKHCPIRPDLSRSRCGSELQRQVLEVSIYIVNIEDVKRAQVLQKAYSRTKPSRCNTYKKQGGTSFKPKVFSLRVPPRFVSPFVPPTLPPCFPISYLPYTLPTSVSRKSFICRS